MKKVLILTASTGEGHNQAARSLQEAYEEGNYKTYKLDFLKETSKTMNSLVADGYGVLAQSFPGFYGKLYEVADRKAFYRWTLPGLYTIERKIVKKISEINPDVIVATHPLAVGVVNRLKVKNRINCGFIAVVTDFKAHYAYVAPSVDAYVTGSDYTKGSLIERGACGDKIFTYGIPVKKAFRQERNSCNLRPFDMDAPSFRVLMMGGSMGVKGVLKAMSHLSFCEPTHIVEVICGRNESLKKTIESQYRYRIGEGKLIVHGFTPHVAEMMENAHVLVTKPGGLTVTEALSKSLPMIIPFAIPGQEQENADFLVSAGVALRVNDLSKLENAIEYLRKNSDIYKAMVTNMKNLAQTYSVDKIVDLSKKVSDSAQRTYLSRRLQQ